MGGFAAVCRRSCVVAVLMAPLSCGGSGGSLSSPTVVPAPAAPSGPTVVVLSGLTGLPLGGVPVVSPGGPSTTDAGGKAILPAASQTGSPMDVSVPAYFDRQTTVKTALDRIFLWPRVFAQGADESFTSRLLYTGTAEGSVEGAAPLRRVVPGLSTAWVFLPPEIRTDARVQVLQTAIAEINAATQGLPTYQLTFDRPTGNQIVFDVAIDGTQSTCAGLIIAFFRITLVSSTNSSEIYGGLLNFCASKWAEDVSVTTHELGHSLGLYHSGRSVDLMYPTAVNHGGFTGEEKLAVFLGLQRRGGNRFPDTDRPTQATGGIPTETVIVCGR